jgi:ribonuclease-3
LILGSGELKSGGFRRDSILSDALEAIMGALLKDQGVDACSEWIRSLFAKKLAGLDLNNWSKDPKTQLQEFLQSRKIDLPVYELVKMSGAAHAQVFSVKCTTVFIDKPCLGSGVSRKKAEQSAAEKMLKIIRKNK